MKDHAFIGVRSAEAKALIDKLDVRAGAIRAIRPKGTKARRG